MENRNESRELAGNNMCREVPFTRKNLLIWKDYQDGMSAEDIAQKYDLAAKTVYYHVGVVDKFFEHSGREWLEQARNRMRARFPEVLEVFDDAIKNKDRKTMNKYLDKMVYPQGSEKPSIQFNQINVEKIAEDLGMNRFKPQEIYDADVEIVEKVNSEQNNP